MNTRRKGPLRVIALESEYCRNRQLVRRAPSGELQALFPAWIYCEPPSARPPPRITTSGFEIPDSADDD